MPLLPEKSAWTNMKKKTIEKIMALPKASQDKVWKLAIDRLKTEKMHKNEVLHLQDKQSKK